MVEVRQGQVLAQNDGDIALDAGEEEIDVLRRDAGRAIGGHVELEVAGQAGATDKVGVRQAVGQRGYVVADLDCERHGHRIWI